MAQHDVFISYNSEDLEWAKQFAGELSELGMSVWFDQWNLVGGQFWQDALVTAIQDSNSVVILIGQSGLGPWEEMELKQALSNLVRRHCPVIPIVLPGVGQFSLPSFLEQCHCIDCRDQLTYPKGIRSLVSGITGRGLIHAVSQEGGEFKLQMPDEHHSIRVHPLPNPLADEKISLTGKTFGQGIKYLHDQIEMCVPTWKAHACIGINDAGLAIASFLAGSVMRRSKIGWIKTEGAPEREIVESDCWFPELPPKPLILLTDSQLKTGSDLKTAVGKVRDKYPDASIYYAVLAAMVSGSEPKIASFDQLRANDVLAELDLEDYFIAFTMIKPGIKNLLGVR